MSRLRAALASGALAVVMLVAAAPANAFEGWLLARNWDELSDEERQKAAENYLKHKKRSQQEQQNLERRYERWQKMPASEKNRFRQDYQKRPAGGLLK